MAGFLSSNCSSGGTLGLISEVLKVGFYGVRPRASCVSRVIFQTRRLMAEIMDAAYVWIRERSVNRRSKQRHPSTTEALFHRALTSITKT